MQNSFLADQKGQLSIEGVVNGAIVIIIYLIIAAFVFQPIYNAMAPTLIGCVGGGYGTIASTLILIGVYVVMPLLLIATTVSMSRPKVEYVQ